MISGMVEAIFWPIKLIFLRELGRLLSIDWFQQIPVWALFAIFDFWTLKRGVALKTQPKSWPTWWTFLVTCYLEIMFPTFQTWFFVKLDFEIAVDQQTKASDRTLPLIGGSKWSETSNK